MPQIDHLGKNLIRSFNCNIPDTALENLLQHSKIIEPQWQRNAKYQIMLLEAFYKHMACLIPINDIQMHNSLRQSISLTNQVLRDHDVMLRAHKAIKIAKGIANNTTPNIQHAYDKILSISQRTLPLLKEFDITYIKAHIIMTNLQLEQRMNWSITWNDNTAMIWPTFAEIAANKSLIQHQIFDKSQEALQAMESTLPKIQINARTAALSATRKIFDNFARQIEQYATRNNIPIHASLQNISGLDNTLQDLRKIVSDLHCFYNDLERLQSNIAFSMYFDIAEARNRLAQIEQYSRVLDKTIMGLVWAESVQNIDGSFSLNHKIALYKQFADDYYQSLKYMDKADLRNNCNYLSNLNQQILTTLAETQGRNPSTLFLATSNSRISTETQQRMSSHDYNTENPTTHAQKLFEQADHTMDLAQRAAHLLNVKMKFAFGKTVAEVAKDQCCKIQSMSAIKTQSDPQPLIQGPYEIKTSYPANLHIKHRPAVQ